MSKAKKYRRIACHDSSEVPEAFRRDFINTFLRSKHVHSGDVLEITERVSTESGQQTRTTFISPADAVAVHVNDPDVILKVTHFVPGSHSFYWYQEEYARLIERDQIYAVTRQHQLKFGKLLLYIFLDRKDIDAELGDLDELFCKAKRDLGLVMATIVYYRHVLKSIWPQLKRSIMKWGMFGWLADAIRRIGF